MALSGSVTKAQRLRSANQVHSAHLVQGGVGVLGGGQAQAVELDKLEGGQLPGLAAGGKVDNLAAIVCQSGYVRLLWTHSMTGPA
jgi:hypothetical protein